MNFFNDFFDDFSAHFSNSQPRTGHVVMAVVPKKWQGVKVRAAVVGLVMTVWVGSKKPKPATSASMSHVIAIRMVEMRLISVEGKEQFEALDICAYHMIQPHCVVSVLDVESCENTSDDTRVTLSAGSLLLVRGMESIPEWWPEMDPEDPKDACQSGLYLPRGGRRKRRAEGKAEGDKKKNQSSQKSKVKKVVVKKAKVVKAKSAGISLADSETDHFAAEKFKKTAAGRALVREMMDKLLTLDKENFGTRPLFNLDGACRLKVRKCEGVLWSKIREETFRCLGAMQLT